MGFFSSRRAEDNDEFISPSIVTSNDGSSVVRVIRSRFYGKNRGKEREQQAASFKTQSIPASQILSPPAPPSSSSYASSPSNSKSPAGYRYNSGNGNNNNTALPPFSSAAQNTKSSSNGSPPHITIITPTTRPRSIHDRSRPSTPSRTPRHAGGGNVETDIKNSASPNRGGKSAMLPPLSPSSRGKGKIEASGAGGGGGGGESPNQETIRTPTDTVTMTLAQRLNELATANAEGLLSEDEYRMLRQNLFERFSTISTVPIETSVVPVARPRPRTVLEGRPISRPFSNYQVEIAATTTSTTTRTPSVHSKSSITSGVTSLFRRAGWGSSVNDGSKDHSDSSSVFSSTSSAANFFKLPRSLSKKSSSSSVRTQGDNMSISSRRTGMGSDRTHSDHHSHFSGVRSTAGSLRKFATPPSSFPTRAIGHEHSRFGGGSGGGAAAAAHNPANVFDEGHLKTSKEIRAEIAKVETEAKSLMDAFHGLELTTLPKVQRKQSTAVVQPAEDSTWTLIPDGQSQRRVVVMQGGVDNADTSSMKSGTSAGTAPSVTRSTYSAGRKVVRQKGGNLAIGAAGSLASSSRSNSVHRKGSFSSSASQERWVSKGGVAPPVPALPAGLAHLGVMPNANGSSVSLVKSNTHLPMTVVPEDEVDSRSTKEKERESFETEMEGIRRRREEVRERYEARLEYLRAKLKGAELHEKLLRK